MKRPPAPVFPLRLAAAALLGAGLAFLPACQSLQAVTDGMTDIAVSAGRLSPDQAASIKRGTAAMAKTFEDITPEQEYYIGRAVAATVFERYPADPAAGLNRYVNLVGQTLALFSDLPETFGGYHFQVLESDEINAFAAPGGLILVTRGMLRCCRTEDALAAVLAHEIGHVQHHHGIQAIRKSRLTSALTTITMEAGKQLGGQDLAQVTQAFEGSIGDITQTLMNSGYSRASEREADATAVEILKRSGYDPNALVAMLREMKAQMKPGGPGFARTHPLPDDRIRYVQSIMGAPPPRAEPAARQRRFERALRGV